MRRYRYEVRTTISHQFFTFRPLAAEEKSAVLERLIGNPDSADAIVDVLAAKGAAFDEDEGVCTEDDGPEFETDGEEG